jgi:trehalose/maltose hydrolase-like predicted phosphorylase
MFLFWESDDYRVSGVWTETADPNNHPNDAGIFNFITGAGGFIQSMVNGYGGVRYRVNSMRINPRVPLSSSSLKLRGVMYLGNHIDIQVNSGASTFSATVSAQDKDAQNLQLVDSTGAKSLLIPGTRVQAAIGEANISPVAA